MSDKDEWDIKNLKALKEELRYLRFHNRSWATLPLVPPLVKRIERAERMIAERKSR